MIATAFAVLFLVLFLSPPESSAQTGSEWSGSFTVGADYQGWTDIDKPQGEFDFWHTNVAANAQRRLGSDSNWSVALQGEYRAFGYRFDGLPGGLDPWDEAHVVRLSPRMMYAIDEKWSLFGGPVGEFSGESGARFSKAIRGGALFGAQWRPRAGLTIGLGVLGITAIEEDFLIQPVVIIDWKISDAWRFSTQSWTSRGGRLEFIYSFADSWEASLAGGRERERFRLDRSAPSVSEGVGEESSLPITLRVAKTLRSGLVVGVHGGVVVNGELRVENENGDNVAVSDFDRSVFGGVSLTVPF
ncbi:MAG: hypothetical protein GY910_11035 [bacterium]|nr:hypothetical protein [bacterium]